MPCRSLGLCRDEGSSPITAVFGLTIFLSFLLLATQFMSYMYARSTVSAAAYDAARVASAVSGTCTGAEQRARSLLGDYGDHLQIECTRGTDSTTVRLVGPSPAKLISGITAAAGGLAEIEQTATVRTERFRPAGGG